MNTPVQTLENAMKPIVDEMFQNGAEEGCRIWNDYNHPLQQAVVILLRAKVDVQEAAMIAQGFAVPPGYEARKASV